MPHVHPTALHGVRVRPPLIDQEEIKGSGMEIANNLLRISQQKGE